MFVCEPVISCFSHGKQNHKINAMNINNTRHQYSALTMRSSDLPITKSQEA